MRRLRGLVVALLALSGCDRAPSGDQVAADVSARLDQAFGGAFEMADLSRRGTAKDVTAPADETRRVVYFDVSLRMRRDLDLGTWDTPGAASLVSMLGAGPKGIYGVKSGGNTADDVIRAHGSAIYRQDKDGWHTVAAAGFAPPQAPVTDNQAPRPVAETLVAALQSTIRSLPPGTAPASNEIIEEELSRAVNNIRARLTHAQAGYAIAAGPERGQYQRLVRALETVERKQRIIPLITAGSVENLRLLHNRDVLFALTQGDIAALAYAGDEPFADLGPNSALRALGSLYIEPLHVIVRAESPVRTMADLSGRTINVGPVGSGSRVTALRILAAHGIPPERVGELGAHTLAPALAALRDGQIDAVIEVIGAPANEIRSAFTTLPLRLVPLDSAVIERLVRENPVYIAAPIPAATYPNLAAAAPTVGVAAILAATTALTPAEAAVATRLVFTTTDLVARGSLQGAQVSPRTARAGLTIPMHEGAARALAEIGSR